jgi:antirestriction protein ArdC
MKFDAMKFATRRGAMKTRELKTTQKIKEEYVAFMDSLMSGNKKYRSTFKTAVVPKKTYRTQKPYVLKRKSLSALREKVSNIIQNLDLTIVHTSDLDVAGEYVRGEDVILMHPLSEYSSEGAYMLTLAHECGHALLSHCYGEMTKAPLFRNREPGKTVRKNASLAYYSEEFFAEAFSYLLCKDSITKQERETSEIYLKDYLVHIIGVSKNVLKDHELVTSQLYDLAQRFVSAV